MPRGTAITTSTCRLGTEVTAIERHKQSVTLPDGEAVSYDKLLLATGSRSRHLKLPGAGADRVYYLRSIEDSEAIRSVLSDGASLAIVGAGWIGLEVAANARDRGAAVTVIETAKLPLLAALGPEIAAGVRRSAPRARRGSAPGIRRRRDHHQPTGGPPA